MINSGAVSLCEAEAGAEQLLTDQWGELGGKTTSPAISAPCLGFSKKKETSQKLVSKTSSFKTIFKQEMEHFKSSPFVHTQSPGNLMIIHVSSGSAA